MRTFSANLFAALLLCALASVFYLWSALERRLDRQKRGFLVPDGGTLQPLVDFSAKTFRALLAVPAAQSRAGNLSSQTTAAGGRHVKGTKKRLAPREVPLMSGSPVDNRIFWSEWLENLLPVGFTEDHALAWRAKGRTSRVVKLERGCGRISNQLATFADGTKACVRYGINPDQVQGETLTYYFASVLGITNLPPLVLSQLKSQSEQWAAVKTHIDSLQWTEGTVVSLTEWISNLSGVVPPAPLRQESRGLHPLLQGLWNRTTPELVELMQWTDLILFDYLTANFDRLVSNLFSLQWDARVMERDTNNLLRTPHGDLVFIDNEAGFVHGYRVLSMWEKYHNSVLNSVCVFRKRTAQRVAELHARGDSRRRLLELYRAREPLSQELGFLSDEHAAVLQQRIDTLYKHILHCKERYSPS